MYIGLSIDAKNRRLQAFAATVDEGGGAGAGTATLTLYAGERPAQPGGALEIEHTELVVLECPYPIADDITNGVMMLGAFAETMATGEGLATWGRFRDGNGDFAADVDAGQEGSGAFVILTRALVYPGVLIGVDSGVLAEG